MPNDSVEPLPARAAITQALKECGPDLLKQPNRMVSYILDMSSESSRDTKIISQQLNAELAEPLVQAVNNPASVSLETARDRVLQMLEEQRSITTAAATEAADALVGGVADYLGKPFKPISQPAPDPEPPAQKDRPAHGDTPRMPKPQQERTPGSVTSSRFAYDGSQRTPSSISQPPQQYYTAVPPAQPTGAPAWLIGLVVFLACAVIVLAGVLYVKGTFGHSSNDYSGDVTADADADETNSPDGKADSDADSEATSDPPVFVSATASTELEPDGYSDSYGAENVLNDDTMHAWNAEYATGDWIQLNADSPQTVHGLQILNGYVKREDVYYKNCRPRNITIELSDGYTQTATLEDAYGKMQDVKFDGAHETDYIKITINTSYAGNKYDDCCISRIEAY